MVFGIAELTLLIGAIIAIIGAVVAITGSNKWVTTFIVFFILMIVGDLSVGELNANLNWETPSNEKTSTATYEFDKKWYTYDPTSCICSTYFGIGSCMGDNTNVAYDDAIQPTFIQTYSIPIKCHLGGIFGTKPTLCPFTYDADRCELTKGNFDSEAGKTGLGREDALKGGFMCDPMIPWQCFLIFGVLPMMIVYLFLLDLLSFGFFSPKLRTLIAAGVSAVSVFSGAFTGFVVELVKITKMGAGPAFLSTVLILALLSTVMRFFTAGAEESTKAKIGAHEHALGSEFLKGASK